MRPTNQTSNRSAAALFGHTAERRSFERSARQHADQPETAPVLTIIIPTLITITICASC
jgi:hypothetical protein